MWITQNNGDCLLMNVATGAVIEVVQLFPLEAGNAFRDRLARLLNDDDMTEDE